MSGNCHMRRLVAGGTQSLEVVRYMMDDVVVHHVGGHLDGAGETLRVGAAVALHHEAVEAHEDAAIVLVGIEPRLQRLDRKSTRLNSSHSCASRMPSSA